MPKKVKEEAEWLGDEVAAPAAGKITFMFSEKLASSVTAGSHSSSSNLVQRRCRLRQTPLKFLYFHT